MCIFIRLVKKKNRSSLIRYSSKTLKLLLKWDSESWTLTCCGDILHCGPATYTEVEDLSTSSNPE